MLLKFRIVPFDAHPDKEYDGGNEHRNQKQCIKRKIAKIEVVVRGYEVELNTQYKELKNKNYTDECSTALVSKRSTASHLDLIVILQVFGLLFRFFVVLHHFFHIILHVFILLLSIKNLL